MNLQAMVASARTPALLGLPELESIYRGYLNRPRAERKKMADVLGGQAVGQLLNVRELFKLPEAWRVRVNHSSDQVPTVGISFWKWRELSFYYGIFCEDMDGYRRGRATPIPNSRSQDSSRVFKTQTPPIPRSVMPRNPLVRRNTYVLFDVPAWGERVLPVDPFLLQRRGEGDFRVLEHWDITEKERQLMALMMK